MLGPRIVGDDGIELRPPVLEDYHLFRTWGMQPEVTRFWGPRFTSETPATAEERLKKDLEGNNTVLWSIAYQGETVGLAARPAPPALGQPRRLAPRRIQPCGGSKAPS